MRRRLLLIVSSVLLLAACESYDCTLYNYVGCYGTFYQDDAMVSLNDTLTITAGQSGPVLLNKAVGTSKLNVPLSYWQEEDTLVLTVKGEYNLVQDTIWITKSNQVHYESPDCPTTLFHTIQGVRSTHEFIDSINIIRSSVNYEKTDNMQIHLFSATD
ncbi:MAG: hypothetical protein J6Y59_08775 [Bacteroidaceae bacterium]|nr:hypothetical protein [Bacteroidaceae bacterium]